MKKLTHPWGVFQCIFITDFIFAFVLTEKYSGGDPDARGVVLVVCFLLFSVFFSLSTFLWLKRSVNAFWFFVSNACTVFSFIFLGLSGSLPVFFIYPAGTGLGDFFYLFFIFFIVAIVLYSVHFFIKNKDDFLSFIISKIKKNTGVIEKELFDFLPEKFMLWDKSPFFLSLVLLASEILGLNFRNIYPHFSAVLITIPLFCIAICFLQLSLVYFFFAMAIRDAGNILNMHIAMSDRRVMRNRRVKRK